MLTQLAWCGSINLPPRPAGKFDHGDVYLPTGRVFVANTAAGTVEVIDGESFQHVATLPNCPEASGVLCAQDDGLVFAAGRAAGKLLVIDAISLAMLQEIAVGARPNGLAWDARRKRLLVADIQDNIARLVDPHAGSILADVVLPGRPRWAVYHRAADHFLVNIREPACVTSLEATTGALVGCYPISSVGPHGLDLDQQGQRAFVACDGGTVIALDLAIGREQAHIHISGAPDVIWYNHQLARLYVAIAEPWVIEVINIATMTVDKRIETEAGAHTTAYDARRQRLYVFLPSCRVIVYEEREVR
jgi:DNA-binding beta-propeller fold protein YncE